MLETYSTKNIPFSSDLSAGLKSNVAIMTYGTIEYVMTNIYDVIFSELSQHDFSILKEDLQIIISHNFQQYKSNISQDAPVLRFMQELL